MKVFQISEVGLIIKEKVLEPFWNSACQKISDNLWLPTKIDSADLDSNLLNSLSSQLVERSWFSTTLKVPLKKKWSKTSPVSFTYSVQDYMDLENIKPKLKTTTKLINIKCFKENCNLFINNNKFFCETHFNLIKDSLKCQGINNNKTQCKYKVIKDGFCGHHILKIDTENTKIEFNHSRKIRINITPEQLNVFRQIFGVSRKIYNSAIYELRKKNTTKKELRDYITKKLDSEFEYVKRVPLKIKQESVGDLIKALDNCYKKFKKTNKSQKCKYRSKKAPSQSIYMNVDSIKKESDKSFYFYPDALSKRYFKNKKDALLKVSEILPEIKTHCRLVLKHNKYLYISIPMEMPKYTKDPFLKDSFVALDPGERCFQTFFSKTLNGQIGYKPRERYIKVLNEADLIKSKIDLLRNKIRKKNIKIRKMY